MQHANFAILSSVVLFSRLWLIVLWVYYFHLLLCWLLRFGIIDFYKGYCLSSFRSQPFCCDKGRKNVGILSEMLKTWRRDDINYPLMLSPLFSSCPYISFGGFVPFCHFCDAICLVRLTLASVCGHTGSGTGRNLGWSYVISEWRCNTSKEPVSFCFGRPHILVS